MFCRHLINPLTMANNANSGASPITLPKGGGALKGIGEKFSPDLFTGTGNFSVPIALPPGRNGFQPEISLQYSTGNGADVFGLGWVLSVPGVSRKTSQGIPIYDDKKDVFILSGAEDLVEVPGAPEGATRYRPRTEGLFALIDHIHTSRQNYWQVKSKDGLISIYGTPRPENAPDAWTDPAVIADPVKPGKIFAWKLTETRDPFGNRIVYEYERDRKALYDQIYLKTIKYVDIDGEENSPRFLVSVQFTYEQRPDEFSAYRPGFEIHTSRRCKYIEVFTHAQEGEEGELPVYVAEGRLTKRYEFIYQDERNEIKDQMPLNGASLLSRIQVAGHDGGATEMLSPLEFSYSRFEPAARKFFPLTGQLPTQSLNDPNLTLVDLSGNGLPDFLEMNGTVRYWRNQGNGRFEMPKAMKDAPAGLQLSGEGVRLADANGDGRTDILLMNGTDSGYYPSRFGAQWDRKSFQRFRQRPSFNLKDPEVQLVDLDGDGISDVLHAGARFECFFLDPKEGWNKTKFVERQALSIFPNVSFSHPRVRWADMSGDGMQDIILVYDGALEYWPNLGHGNWAPKRQMWHCPRFPRGYDPKRILLGDVDGDGLADLLYVEDNKVTLWINQSGTQWSAPIVIKGTPPVSDLDNLSLIDLLGTGVSGLLWSGVANGFERSRYFFLDFTGGIKPYLLREMNNHMGALTRVEYRSSSAYFLEDAKRPETRWLTNLPFPVQVVAKVEVIDEISKGKLTTEYTYHHGYWDGAEREFRGFGRVDQRDTESFEHYHSENLHPCAAFEAVQREYFSPSLETRSWFHQGPIGDEFGDWTETDFRHEFWPGDANMLVRPDAMRAFLKNLPRRSKRDALRTLRGSLLRTELYALDQTNRQNRPYTVVEYQHGVAGIPVMDPWPTHPEPWQLKIFFPHGLAQRTTQWERGDDPLTQFAFTENYDNFGQPLTQVAVACPRGWRTMQEAVTNQGEVPGMCTKFLATRSKVEYARPQDETVYIHNRTSRSVTYEIPHPVGSTYSLEALIALPPDETKIIAESLQYYDGPAFEGLPEGLCGPYGAVSCAKTLVLTKAMLDQAWGQDKAPVWLLQDHPEWQAEYPAAFRDKTAPRGGFVVSDGKYYTTARTCYDFQKGNNPVFGLAQSTKDPLGFETSIQYDAFHFLPIQVMNAVGLTTTAEYNYRTFQPLWFRDENGNRQYFFYSPLGLPKTMAVLGKKGEYLGDEGPDGIVPGTRFDYDLLAFYNSPPEERRPIWVRTRKREYHISDPDAPAGNKEDTLETVEYSDGFGRLVQTRAQAEDLIWTMEQPDGTPVDGTFGNAVLPVKQDETPAPGQKKQKNWPLVGIRNTDAQQPNVVVSGWQVYDNKGRVVEKYEPFFAKGWQFEPPTDDQKGQKAKMYYDPRGQVIRTLNPDGSEQQVIYGIPESLGQPERYAPTPWEAYTYDPNDNAGRTHGSAAAPYSTHWNTPANITVDALGRTLIAVSRTGAAEADQFITRSAYDIRGNLLAVTDPMGRQAFTYVYDLTYDKEKGSRAWRIDSIDAGLRQMAFDARGLEAERRDSKGALTLQANDALGRPTHLWARDNALQSPTLRQWLQYGDEAEMALPEGNANLLGKLCRHYDEAGRVSLTAYDFKGNLLQKSRRVIKDEAILAVMGGTEMQHFVVDWAPDEDNNISQVETKWLEEQAYATDVRYDALNRVVQMTYPEDVEGKRRWTRPVYNRAGAIEQLSLFVPDGSGGANQQQFVRHIAYNAKGQRTLVAYGNGILTRYAYQPETFRLARLRSEKHEWAAPDKIQPQNGALQDFGYTYDLAGNILCIRHREPNCGIGGGDALDQEFTYDPLYRLLSATGREQNQPLVSDPTQPWLEDMQRFSQDYTQTRGYQQEYTYDKAGNLTELRHQICKTANAPWQVDYVKILRPHTPNNRLDVVEHNGLVFQYHYDDNGNMTRETLSRRYYWNQADQLHSFRQQPGDEALPTLEARYLYGADGMRIKKLVRTNGSVRTTVYVDQAFEYYRDNTVENNTLHLMDDQNRVAFIRVGTALPGDESPAVQYQLGDHLGNCNVTLDSEGKWVNKEEYFPYGATSFGGYGKKRFRYSGKERDEESGLIYYGARYYLNHIEKWLSCDPMGLSEGNNSYCFVKNNPINVIDYTGRQSTTLEKIDNAREIYTDVFDYVGDICGFAGLMYRGAAIAQLAVLTGSAIAFFFALLLAFSGGLVIGKGTDEFVGVLTDKKLSERIADQLLFNEYYCKNRKFILNMRYYASMEEYKEKAQLNKEEYSYYSKLIDAGYEFTIITIDYFTVEINGKPRELTQGWTEYKLTKKGEGKKVDIDESLAEEYLSIPAQSRPSFKEFLQTKILKSEKEVEIASKELNNNLLPLLREASQFLASHPNQSEATYKLGEIVQRYINLLENRKIVTSAVK